MSKARIIHELHDDFGVPISEAEKAYDIAVEYIRLRSAIGDHPEDYEPSEYVLIKASAQPKIIYCGECKYMMPNGRCLAFADPNIRPSASDYCSGAERRQDG